MGIEHQMMTGGRAFGKAIDHNRQKLIHLAERRVHLETRVMFQLQKDKVTGKSAMLDLVKEGNLSRP